MGEAVGTCVESSIASPRRLHAKVLGRTIFLRRVRPPSQQCPQRQSGKSRLVGRWLDVGAWSGCLRAWCCGVEGESSHATMPSSIGGRSVGAGVGRAHEQRLISRRGRRVWLGAEGWGLGGVLGENEIQPNGPKFNSNFSYPCFANMMVSQWFYKEKPNFNPTEIQLKLQLSFLVGLGGWGIFCNI